MFTWSLFWQHARRDDEMKVSSSSESGFCSSTDAAREIADRPADIEKDESDGMF